MKNRICHYTAILLVFLTTASALAFSQNKPRPARPGQNRSGAPFLQSAKSYEETPYVTKVVLKNGLTVLVNEFRIQPVMSVQLFVGAGILDEPLQAVGTARLAAEMAQRGRTDAAGSTLRQNAYALGGILRCAVDYRSTVFEIVASSKQWKRALNAQADSILSPLFDQSAINAEARLMMADQAVDGIGSYEEMLLELAFNESRMAGGTGQGSAAIPITSEVVSSFYKKYYNPANMMLVISGDISSSEVLNEVARIYSKMPGAGAKNTPYAVTPQNGFRYRAVPSQEGAASVLFGFHTPPGTHEDFNALEVLRAVIGIGENSILSWRLRDQKKVILSSKVMSKEYPGFGFLSLNMKVKPADIDRSELALLTEFEILKRQELTDGELERAQAQLEREYWASLETVTGRGRALAHFESLGDWKGMDRYLSELRKVSAADVKRVAAKYLTLENCSVIEFLPASLEDRKLTVEGVRRTFDELAKPSADQEIIERNKKTVLAVDIPSETRSFRFSEIQFPFQTASILRGPSLFIREDHTNPLVEMGLFYPGGKLEEKKENAGITRLMVGRMLRGTGDLDQFYRQLEIYGAQVTPVIADDYFGVYLSVLSQNIEPAVKMLIEAVKAPDFDKEAVERQKEMQIAEIAGRKNAFPCTLLKHGLFPGFAYGLDSYGSEESVAGLTPESLGAWYEAHVKNQKPVAVLIGDTKGTSLASGFVKNFSGSRMQDVKIPEAFAKAIEKGEVKEQNWDKKHSLILVGFQAPPEDDEDLYAVSVLQSYMGNPGRLAQELKDRLGLASEVVTSYKPLLRGGLFLIEVSTVPENEEEILKALKAEIQRMSAGPVPARDFRSAVFEAAGAYVIKQQRRRTQIETLTRKVLAGKGIDGYQNFPAGLEEVKEEDLKPVIDRILNLDRAVIVEFKGKKPAAAELRSTK